MSEAIRAILQNTAVILIGSILINNFVFSRFYGICPFLGVSKKVSTAFGMGMAVTFVMTMASILTYLIKVSLLVPLHVDFLQTIAFIMVIAVLVQLVEMMLKKLSYGLYQALGIYLPLITTNCAVLAVAVENMENGLSFFASTLTGFGAALGFTLAIVLFAGIRERMELTNLPKWMEGFPGALITAGLMSVAFLGFKGFLAMP